MGDMSPDMSPEKAYPDVQTMEMKHAFNESIRTPPEHTGRRRAGVFGDVDDSKEAFYAPIEAFEGRHHYDAAFEWDSQEERRLVRKVSK